LKNPSLKSNFDLLTIVVEINETPHVPTLIMSLSSSILPLPCDPPYNMGNMVEFFLCKGTIDHVGITFSNVRRILTTSITSLHCPYMWVQIFINPPWKFLLLFNLMTTIKALIVSSSLGHDIPHNDCSLFSTK
jgi:hypothetical protein